MMFSPNFVQPGIFFISVNLQLFVCFLIQRKKLDTRVKMLGLEDVPHPVLGPEATTPTILAITSFPFLNPITRGPPENPNIHC